MLHSNRFEKADRFENTDYWCPISEDCDHDRNSHKNALFMRIATIIAVLIKCPISEDCDPIAFFWSQSSQKCHIYESLKDCNYDRSLHKNALFFRLYRIVTKIAVIMSL